MSKFSWCLHCEKAFEEAEECPYCGARFGDIWEWDKVRTASEFRSTEYPEIPEIGKVYPLYDNKKEF